MAQKQWTNEQKRAIEARGGTLLVSAAAGSGKTAVLVERVIERITDLEHPCDADRLLVVTFTNAAAAEMRARLAARLHTLSEERPSDSNLRRQQILLQHAHISTIHAFCLDLLRANFEKLDIPPDFRIADENEARVMLNDTLDELLEEAYTDGGAFTQMTEMLGAGRDDAGLADTIVRLFDFLRSLPDPDGWLRDKLALYRTDVPLANTLWGQAALHFASASLENAQGALRAAMQAMQGYEPLEKAYGGAFASLLAQVEQACMLAGEQDWDGLVAAVQGMVYDRLGVARKVDDTALRDRLKAVRDGVKAQISKLCEGILCCSESEYCADVERLRPLAESLFAVVRQLDRRFYAKKAEKGILDFSDLERLAIQLLRADDGAPTAAARAVAAQFEEVLVDEYQDVNPAQDAIFRAVSRGEKNLFMVGDVKQSIYRFRKATPELFIQKKDMFSPYNGHTYPARVVLGRNFRSRAGVAEAVNFVFGQLMSRELGGIDYGEEERMIPAATYFEKPANETDFSLHLIETDAYDENDDNAVLEARHVARLIGKMLREHYPVQGADGPRPAVCRDFCILLRGANRLAQAYVDALKEENLPAYADIAGGYLGSYEVAVMLSLLRVLDNPLQDIPLLSVMLSPVFSFSPDDMARLRLQYPKGRLYLAAMAQAKKEGGRFAVFVELLDELRRLAAVLPSDRLILRVYERTGFLDICTAMPGGEGRRANLRLLLDYARGYEAAGFRGLAGFVRFVDRVAEDADLPPASTVSEEADVVRVMSIHKSKGLEFPVCIVAGCGRRFNREDSRRGTLFHPEYGFGSYLRDPSLPCHVTTLPREVVRIETERGSIAEEMRVLYVAMTRAKEKLICVATVPSAEKAVVAAAGLMRPDGEGLSSFAAMQAQHFAAWLLACVLRHPSCGRLRSLVGLEELPILPTAHRMELVITDAEGAAKAPAGGQKMPAQPVDEVLLAEIERRVAFVYPHEQLTHLPSKLAVSEIAEEGLHQDFGARRPSFVQGGLSAAQKGTATHTFMQLADLARIHSADDVSVEVRRLVQGAHLLPEEGEAVDAGRVMAFLETPLYVRIRQAEQIWKELRFNLIVSAGELDGMGLPDDGWKLREEDENDAQVVLQGMADVVFLEQGRYYILDYKTDHANAETLRARYAGQLALYARAVEQIFHAPVEACYLYGFTYGTLVTL
ncbi:MAG: helicase-exonuclease AddAB subunit AddA [Ethanoligenens sp.]